MKKINIIISIIVILSVMAAVYVAEKGRTEMIKDDFVTSINLSEIKDQKFYNLSYGHEIMIDNIKLTPINGERKDDDYVLGLTFGAYKDYDENDSVGYYRVQHFSGDPSNFTKEQLLDSNDAMREVGESDVEYDSKGKASLVYHAKGEVASGLTISIYGEGFVIKNHKGIFFFSYHNGTNNKLRINVRRL